MKKIVLAVTGGIAAYKAADVLSALVHHGYEVKVITTDSALNFVSPHVLNVLSHGQLITETPGETKHIDLAKWCDAYVLVPATANTLAKISRGLADNLVTTTFLALPPDKHRFLCPAMNTAMYNNPFTQENLTKLAGADYLGNSHNRLPHMHIINPVEGLLACGDIGMGKLAPTKTIVETIVDTLEEFPNWYWPFGTGCKLGTTNDSYSFLDFDWTRKTEIPVDKHVGAFGVRRRHDVHKGIDLYAKVGQSVWAVEAGFIVDICPFTGEVAGFPWWENTWGVYVAGKSGIVVYGEINPHPSLKKGDAVVKGAFIGSVLRVLKKDNGRPMSMLHLELHAADYVHTAQWQIGQPPPVGILNPTKHLLKAKG